MGSAADQYRWIMKFVTLTAFSAGGAAIPQEEAEAAGSMKLASPID